MQSYYTISRVNCAVELSIDSVSNINSSNYQQPYIWKPFHSISKLGFPDDGVT